MKPLVPPPHVEGVEAGTEDDSFVNIPPNNISLLLGADIPLSALPLTASMPLPPSTSWKNSDYEGKRGVWVGTEGSFTLVYVGHIKLQVPSKYVSPILPSTKGKKVMILDEVLMGTAGKIFLIGQAQDAM
ncbi:hypothetical protein C0995_001235 [Termitomyces sp. Mi166|nr:hypothetical protein C0995_001235 [Termitomyces sp. Mi166\